MKYSKFSSQLGYYLKIFRDPGQILVVLGYWAPIKFYLFYMATFFIADTMFLKEYDYIVK